MDWMTPVYLLIAMLFVLMNGFFVLAEFALVKVRATRIEELARQGNRQAIVARDMVLHLDNYLAATQLGITWPAWAWAGSESLHLRELFTR